MVFVRADIEAINETVGKIIESQNSNPIKSGQYFNASLVWSLGSLDPVSKEMEKFFEEKKNCYVSVIEKAEFQSSLLCHRLKQSANSYETAEADNAQVFTPGSRGTASMKPLNKPYSRNRGVSPSWRTISGDPASITGQNLARHVGSWSESAPLTVSLWFYQPVSRRWCYEGEREWCKESESLSRRAAGIENSFSALATVWQSAAGAEMKAAGMASAQWLRETAEQAAALAGCIKEMNDAFQDAYYRVTPPVKIEQNRKEHDELVTGPSSFLRASRIAELEREYEDMRRQNSEVMEKYVATAQAVVRKLMPFTDAPSNDAEKRELARRLSEVSLG